jgi:hypothetical protein
LTSDDDGAGLGFLLGDGPASSSSVFSSPSSFSSSFSSSSLADLPFFTGVSLFSLSPEQYNQT